MVQEYLMGGYRTTNTIDSWLNGYTADFYDIVTQGNFYQGNDKDLINTITPLINLDNPEIKNAAVKINTGANDV
jgi:hypothetical protein